MILWRGQPVGAAIPTAMLGVILIGLGLLLYAMPKLLAYFIAGLFILAGCGMLLSAWRMRRTVSYRRVDASTWRAHGPDEHEA
jgi:uncharacterized membrane protein HdeD (DUF308 family)